MNASIRVKAGERPTKADAAAILPLKDATGAAFAAVVAVAEKVEDYFTRCSLAAFDSLDAAAMNPEGARYVALAYALTRGQGRSRGRFAVPPCLAVAEHGPLIAGGRAGPGTGCPANGGRPGQATGELDVRVHPPARE